MSSLFHRGLAQWEAQQEAAYHREQEAAEAYAEWCEDNEVDPESAATMARYEAFLEGEEDASR